MERLKETIDEIAGSADNNYGEEDKEFHRIIALSANNPIIEGMIDPLLITHDKMDRQIRERERDVTVQLYIKTNKRFMTVHLKSLPNPKEAFSTLCPQFMSFNDDMNLGTFSFYALI